MTISKIVSGGAPGADHLAERYAVENKLDLEIYPADWKKYGKSAGPKRNTQIVESSDVIVAFWDGISPGTKDTIEKAKKLGKNVIVVEF